MLELMEMRAVITENLCLAYGCYDIIMYDDWGDGMDGTSCKLCNRRRLGFNR